MIANVLMCAAVQEVASEIKGMIEDFRPYIPLIQGLRNPGMRNRHWEQVCQTFPFNFTFVHQICIKDFV